MAHAQSLGDQEQKGLIGEVRDEEGAPSPDVRESQSSSEHPGSVPQEPDDPRDDENQRRTRCLRHSEGRFRSG